MFKLCLRIILFRNTVFDFSKFIYIGIHFNELILQGFEQKTPHVPV
jgi:hypothetical protein